LSIALKLGWTNNLLHDGRRRASLVWSGASEQRFGRRSRSESRLDELHPDEKRFRTTVWLYPLFSSRWPTCLATAR